LKTAASYFWELRGPPLGELATKAGGEEAAPGGLVKEANDVKGRERVWFSWVYRLIVEKSVRRVTLFREKYRRRFPGERRCQVMEQRRRGQLGNEVAQAPAIKLPQAVGRPVCQRFKGIRPVVGSRALNWQFSVIFAV
jgi:hypothetical protein